MYSNVVNLRSSDSSHENRRELTKPAAESAAKE